MVAGTHGCRRSSPERGFPRCTDEQGGGHAPPRRDDMPRRTDGRVTAARAAAASVAVAAVLLGAAPRSLADGGAAVPTPTPTPAPRLSPLVPAGSGSTAAPGAGADQSGSQPLVDTGFGSVAGDLVLPVFAEIRVVAA